MSVLANYTPERAEVAFKGGVLRVRGLTLDDIGLLIRAHLPEFEQMFAIYRGAMDGPAAGDPAARLVLAFAQDAPRLCAQVIAIAADEPDMADAAMRLPFPTVIDALTKIGRLTFEDIGGPVPFANALAGLIGGLRSPASAPTTTQASSTTTGGSETT